MIDKKQAQQNGFKIVESDKKIADQKDEKLAALKKLIPNLVNSDGQVNKQALDDFINLANTTSNNKGYELTFAGKGIARAKADNETTKELQTEKKQSKYFDTTDNVVIRGDNLEVLKVLQQNYHEKIKMIYIDPPYNTEGEKFIYNDNFKQSEGELLKTYGLDEEEDQETLNFLHNVYGTRSHSGWLSFMYPRLKLARDLLKEDGVIFISIDDNEQANLKIMCDEIFGEDNFIGNICWNSTKSVTNTALLSISHNNNFVYAKDIDYYIKNRKEFRLKENGEGFSNPDNDPRGVWKADPFQVGGWRRNQQYEIKNPNTEKIYKPNNGCSWKNDLKKFEDLLADKRIVFGVDGKSAPQRKRFLSEALERGRVAKTWWDDVGTTTNGTQELKNIFNINIFTNPKPLSLLKRIIELGDFYKNDLILDFFAGSGTTGDAVMQLNAEDGGKRKFILVQWDEVIDKKKNQEAYNFCTENKFKPVISSITLERLNRAGEKIKKENEGKLDFDNQKLDIGYKVFSLTEKPKIIEQEQTDENQQAIESFKLENQRTETQNTLYNMLCATCKPLHTEIKEIIKDKLYQADNEIYLLGEVTQDELEPYKDQKINIDGWSNISLENWLNLDVGNKENVRVVY